MVDFDDHLEDIGEENDEFRHAVEEVLEEQTGIRWRAGRITERPGRIEVNIQPAGTVPELTDAFGTEVDFSGNLSVNFQK